MDKGYTELFDRFSRLQWLLRRNHMQNHMEHGPMANPTRGQGRVLALLKMQPEISSKDLAYLLGIRQQSLNELLNKLEKGGYVTRTPSEEDRRVMLVKITEKGKAEQQIDVDYADIFNCLTEEEQKTLAEYIDRIIAHLEEQLGLEDEDEEMFERMNKARAYMGEEKFERLMSMRGGWGGFRHRDFHDMYCEGPEDERFFHGRGRPPRPGRDPRDGMRGERRRRGGSGFGPGEREEWEHDDENPKGAPSDDKPENDE